MVYGICTSEALDSQGEVVLHEAIVKAWDAYMEYANIREMHQPSAVGVTKEFSHGKDGTWIGVHVVDDRAWKFVKEGVYKGFSIGGRVTKKTKNIIEGIILAEISLVDRPANPDAMFSVTKVDGDLVDQLQLEASEFLKMKKNFIEIEGVKYVEDPENAGQPLKDATSGENVAWTDEDQAALDAGAEAPADGGEKKDEEEKTEAGADEAEKPADDGAGEGENKEVAAPADEAGAGEGAEGEKESAADASWVKRAEAAGVLTKDADGVIALASLLDHLKYVAEYMGEKMEGALKPVETALMAAIGSQTKDTKEDAEPVGDLQKMFGSELSKAMAPMLEKMGTLEQSIDAVKADVDTIKGTRVSPRPAGAAPVEKVIENGSMNKGAKDAIAKRKEFEAIATEIDAFAKEWGPKVEANPSLQKQYMEKATELHKKYTACQRELSALVGETGGM